MCGGMGRSHVQDHLFTVHVLEIVRRGLLQCLGHTGGRFAKLDVLNGGHYEIIPTALAAMSASTTTRVRLAANTAEHPLPCGAVNFSGCSFSRSAVYFSTNSFASAKPQSAASRTSLMAAIFCRE